MRYLVILLFLSSCSCDWHLQRAEAKCGKLVNDTITVVDTLIIPTIQKDTVFKYNVRDTVIVHQKNMTYKYYFRQKDSTVYLDGKCLGDTIIKVIKVPYEKTVVKVDFFPDWLKWVGGIIGVLFVLLIIYKKFVS